MSIGRKIKPINQLADIIHSLKNRGKKVGMITGCFDILHIGHIELFEAAKQHVDILIVGLDSDRSIKLSKGQARPFFSFFKRAKVLSSLEFIDFIFKIPYKFVFNTNQADLVHKRLLKKLKPSAVLTNPRADKWWEKKAERAKASGVKFIPLKGRKNTSTTIIAKRLHSEI